MLWTKAAKAECSLLEEKGVFRIVEETELKKLLKDGTHILGSSNTKTYAAVASGTAIRTIVSVGVADKALFHHIDI
eukprot:3912214-Rhodomonas_salina.2